MIVHTDAEKFDSRLNSLGIFHPCAKTNEPKNINTKIAIMRSLKAAQFSDRLTDNRDKKGDLTITTTKA